MSARRRFTVAIATLTTASLGAWGILATLPSAAVAKPILIRKVSHGFYHQEPDHPIYILALASDQGAPRYKRGGNIKEGRSDSIHIIAINPKTRSGSIVGIPRDTFVSMDGFTGKINGAMAAGGPDKMVKIVEDLSGVKFDYYVITSFDGFEDAVNEIGGIVVDVPYDMRDGFSNAFFKKGQQVLGGYQALAFARNRHSTPNGDFSRSENQGLVMLGAMRRARAEAFKNPGVLLKYLRIFFKYVATDIPVDEALQLAILSTQVQTQDMTNIVVDGYSAMEGGASIVKLTPKGFGTLHDVADDGLLNGSASDAQARPVPSVKQSTRRRHSTRPTPSESPSESPSGSPSGSPSRRGTGSASPVPSTQPS